MNDGGYSRIEKDFLGNERMVHYDGSGNMLGASDVVREPDGTIRIPNESGSSFVADDLPKVEAVEPKPKAVAQEPASSFATPAKSNVPMNQVVLYSIATFIGAMLLTLGIASFVASRRPSQGAISSTQIRSSNPMEDARIQQDPPRRREEEQQPQDNFPIDPKPRNDEQPSDEPKPFDNAAPDMNSGDDLHPKIEPGDGDKKPAVEPAKENPKTNGSDDPIDLRGDGGTTKKGPDNSSDPDDIH